MKMILAIPFKILHRVLGALMAAVMIATLALGAVALILAVIGLIAAAIAGGIVWLAFAFVCAVVGSALLALVRVFDPEYMQGRDNAATTILKTVKSRGDDLQSMARDHL